MIAYEIVGGLVVLALILTGLHTVLTWAEDKGKKGKRT
jgi:hypothetical protein